MKSKYTIVDVTQPKEGYIVFLDRYWLCKEGLPQQAIFYKDIFPQCNKSENLMRKLTDISQHDYFVQIVFIPVAYVKPLD